MNHVNQLWLSAPSEISSMFGVGDWYDSTNSVLVLPIQSGDYKRLSKSEGSRLNSAGFLSVKTIPYSLEVTCRVSNVALRAAVQRLAKSSIHTGGEPKLLQLYDFVWVEDEDIETAIANSTTPYTVRVGSIPPDTIGSSGAVNGFAPRELHASGGFSFTFHEYKTRLS